MLAIPEIDDVSVAFGDITHMPTYAKLPEEFQKEKSPFCDVAARWFYSGGKRDGKALIIGDYTLTPKEGVDDAKALKAIKAILGSWEPKHEHKMAACGFMLSEWFDLKKRKG